MAAVELEFALDVSRKTLSSSHLALAPFALPDLFAGDTLSLRVRLVEPAVGGQPGKFALVPLDGITMRVGIGAVGAPLTNADLAVDGDALAGNLPLNVAPITGLVFPALKIFEFRVAYTGGFYKRVQFPCSILGTVLAVTTVPVAPPDEALSKNEAREMYVPRDGGVAGQWFAMKDEDTGQIYRVYMKGGELLWTPAL